MPPKPRVPISRARLWTSRGLSLLLILFMIFDGVIHITKPVPVVDAFNQLGLPIGTAVGIGIAELVCAVLYALPRTAVIGAVMLTGIYGGAVAIHVRTGDPLFPTYVFPAMLGILTWGSLMLRDERLAALLLRRD